MAFYESVSEGDFDMLMDWVFRSEELDYALGTLLKKTKKAG